MKATTATTSLDVNKISLVGVVDPIAGIMFHHTELNLLFNAFAKYELTTHWVGVVVVGGVVVSIVLLFFSSFELGKSLLTLHACAV
jgi:hypothetical protein